MLKMLIYGMVFLGAALMIYNIWGFVSYAAFVHGLKSFKKNGGILYVPIVLLVMFLLGYLAVGIFGKPDLIVSGILFGGSVFVCIIYRLINDITRRVVESEKTESRLLAAEEANRAKNSFLASISHEMRTPLNVILGLDSVALRDRDLSVETKDHLEKIGLSAKHLLGLINNILSINQIESGDLLISQDTFSMSEALAQVNVITESLAGQKGLTYETRIEPDAEGMYLGDVMKFKQVLLSILDNAVKYTDAPGTVSLSAESVGEKEGARLLRFTISDTGVGIDPEFLPHVFDVFTQEDASFSNRFGGSGLSLALTKSVVELVGGTIEVQSRKNEGSVFTVTLPLQPAETPAPGEEAPEAGAVSLEGKHILIVEDLPENAEIVQDLLELEGVETEHAENGQVALEMFDRSPAFFYDAILMDLRMPVMDGLESTRRIRALRRADAKIVPIVALTANAFESDVRASLEAGMDVHLAKPADAETLYATLRGLIAQRRNARGEDEK